MYIDKPTKDYKIQFVEKMIEHFSDERLEYYRIYNIKLCSLLIIRFVSEKQKYLVIDKNNFLDFIVDFEMFIRSFNNYYDIQYLFEKSTDELNKIFQESSFYTKNKLPVFQMSILEDKGIMTKSLLEIKRMFKYCSTLISRDYGQELIQHCLEMREE